LLALLCSGRAASQPVADDSLRAPIVDALQVEAEIDLDATVRAEWDALLADPVDLDRGDLQRLRVLPWIGETEIAALVAGRPFASVEDLQRLPGWSRAALERLRPFVEVRAGRAGAPRWNATAHWSESTARARFAAGAWTLSGRTDPQDPLRTTGVVRADTRRWHTALGDVRCTHALGLLLASGTSSARAGESGWREGRGLTGLEGFDRARSLRGAGVACDAGMLQVAVLAGRHAAGRGQAIACRLHCDPAFELRAAALALADTRALSVGFAAGRPASRLAFEAAGWGKRWAFGGALEVRHGPHRGTARLQVAPFDAPLPFGSLSAAARRAATCEVQASVATRRGPVHLELGWAATRRVEADGALRHKREQAVAAETRIGRTQCTMRILRRATRDEDWENATSYVGSEEVQWAWIVRARQRLFSGWAGVATLRGAQETIDPVGLSTAGRAWQIRLERVRGAWRPELGLGAHDVDAGIALAESAPAGGFATASLRGAGIRTGIGLRGAWHGLELRAGAWNEWPATVLRRGGAAVSFGMRIP
jgi:hypothetical protein